MVVRAEEDSIACLQDLAGRTVHVRQSSSFYTTLIAFADSIEGLQVASLPDSIETEDILAGVEEGRYDVTLCDSNLLDVELALRAPAQGGLQHQANGFEVGGARG